MVKFGGRIRRNEENGKFTRHDKFAFWGFEQEKIKKNNSIDENK